MESQKLLSINGQKRSQIQLDCDLDKRGSGKCSEQDSVLGEEIGLGCI